MGGASDWSLSGIKWEDPNCLNAVQVHYKKGYYIKFLVACNPASECNVIDYLTQFSILIPAGELALSFR